MTVLSWLFASTLFVLYIALLMTVCLLTFKKGYTILGIIGIVFPILWLIGAVIPAKPNSRYALEEATRGQTHVEPYMR